MLKIRQIADVILVQNLHDYRKIFTCTIYNTLQT